MAIPDRALATLDQMGENPFEKVKESWVWLKMLGIYLDRFDNYNKGCDLVDGEYSQDDKLLSDYAWRPLPVFWANMEVIKPTIYSRAPVPVVSGRHKDRRPLIRQTSELLERALISQQQMEKLHRTLKHVRDDLVMYSRGVIWLRKYEDPVTKRTRVKYDHLNRHDFRHQVCRKWDENEWVARRAWLTRPQIKQRFDAAYQKLHGKTLDTSTIAFTTQPNDQYENEDRNSTSARNESETSQGNEETVEQKASVWEIWHKTQNAVVWVTEGLDLVLDIGEPHLDLEGFFPCPEPAYSTLKPDTLYPIPHLTYYRGQVDEINLLTERIMSLSEALKVKFFYSAGIDGDVTDAIENALKNTDQNAIAVPVPSTAALGGSGLANAIVWLPVEVVAATLRNLIELRDQMQLDVYEITGISDIMRGSTDPSETLGAQQLKGQFGSVRVKERQEEMVRIARDATNIAGEIMAEHFSMEELLLLSQYDQAPPQEQIQQQVAQIQGQKGQMEAALQRAAQDPNTQQMAEQNPEQAQQIMQQAQQQIAGFDEQLQELSEVVTQEQIFELLQNERIRPFVLDIETDSTIQPDEQRDKANVSEFLGALAQILAQLSPMVDNIPESAPFAAEVLMFAVKPFRVGRPLMGAIEQFAENIEEKAKNPNPEQQAAIQAEMQKIQAEVGKLQADAGKSQAEAKRAEADVIATAVETKKTQAETQKLEAETFQLMAPEPEEAEDEPTEVDAMNAENDLVKAGVERQKLDVETQRMAMEMDDMAQQRVIEQDHIQAMAEMSEQLAESAQAIAQMAESIAVMQAAMTAPRELVRDEQGRAIGARTVLNS